VHAHLAHNAWRGLRGGGAGANQQDDQDADHLIL
jgi:hypothetical protein